LKLQCKRKNVSSNCRQKEDSVYNLTLKTCNIANEEIQNIMNLKGTSPRRMPGSTGFATTENWIPAFTGMTKRSASGLFAKPFNNLFRRRGRVRIKTFSPEIHALSIIYRFF
jgi:hypothetical protein